MHSRESIKATKIIFYVFIFCCIGSFLYSIITGTYNGDFLGVKVNLDVFSLVFNLLCALLPFIFLWRMYLRSKAKKEKRLVNIPMKFFRVFLILLIFWNIAVTIIYGVGILAAPPYEAPPSIKVVIQVLNRFNYTYGVFIYLLICPKKEKFQIILIILLLVLAYLRAGLGIFIYLFMIYLVKFYKEFIFIVKRRKTLIICGFFAFPIVVNYLYGLRNELRGQVNDEVVANPLTGNLMGRMSSFSDSAFILQNWDYFQQKSLSMDSFYFQLQCLGGVVSTDFMPDKRPEILLFRYYYSDLEDNVAYMAGTNGNMYFSFMKSPLVLLLNIISIIFLIVITFKVFRKLNFKYNNELAFILLIYAVTSGVANEYAFLLFSIFVYLVLFLFVKSFNKI